MEPITLMWSALGALAVGTFGAMGWLATRSTSDTAALAARTKEEVDALWKAVNELQRDTREYVTRRDLSDLEQRLERSLSSHEQRVLAAIRLGLKGSAAE